MNGWTYTRIIGKYKTCPNCGASYKTNDIQTSLKDEIITISCKCGFIKKVDEYNKNKLQSN